MKWVVGLAIVSAIIGVSVLLGGYMPNVWFNQRAVLTTCHRWASVDAYTCRNGAISQTCYDVRFNTKPDPANCWDAPRIATFVNQDQANAYAASYASYDFSCYFDWKNRCTYYNGLADIQGTLYAGIAFTVTSAILFGIPLGVAVYGCCKRRKYDQLIDNESSV